MIAELNYKEGRITLTLQAYQNGYFTIFWAATNTYDVPASTLRSCVKGIPLRHGL